MTDLQERSAVDASPRARRGAHRAARPRLLVLLPVLVVVAVVGVAVLAAVFFTGLGGAGEPSAPVAAPTPAVTTLPEVSAPPALEPDEDGGAPGADGGTDAPTPGSGSTEDAAGSDPSDGEGGDDGADEGPAAEADPTTPVVVLNSTRTSGLAADAAEELEGSGWAVARTGDQPGGAVPVTLVRYRDAEQEATARAVAQAVGGSPTVEQDPSVSPDVITVIMGADRA